MLSVAIEESEPGMQLAVGVTHPDKPGHELLRPGFTLTLEAIAQLRELGIGFIYVDYPGLEALDRHFAAHLSAARQAVYQQIKAGITSIQRSTKLVAGFADYYSTTRELITTLLSQGRQPCYVEILSGGLGKDGVAHATAVAQLALTLGIRLETYLIQQRSRLPVHQAKQVVNVGIAGMLHDIGKAKLPAEVQDRTGIALPADQKQRQIWESHPRLGYELIHDGVEATAAAAVLNHHQHYDGSGFPRLDAATAAPRGEKVHVFARIILAADLYDRLASGPAGQRRPGIEVLHLIRTRYAGWVDPEILKTFAAVVPPFPPGSKVKLSDGSMAIVMGPNPNDPYRPTVRPLSSETGELGAAVQLSVAGAPSIVTAMGISVAKMVPNDRLAA